MEAPHDKSASNATVTGIDVGCCLLPGTVVPPDIDRTSHLWFKLSCFFTISIQTPTTCWTDNGGQAYTFGTLLVRICGRTCSDVVGRRTAYVPSSMVIQILNIIAITKEPSYRHRNPTSRPLPHENDTEKCHDEGHFRFGSLFLIAPCWLPSCGPFPLPNSSCGL